MKNIYFSQSKLFFLCSFFCLFLGSIFVNAQTISPYPPGTNSLTKPTNTKIKNQKSNRVDTPQAESSSCYELAGSFCAPCDDPQSGLALHCPVGTSQLIHPIDVSGIGGLNEVTEICYMQESFGLGPLLTINLYCDPGGGTVPYDGGGFTPIASQSYQSSASDDGSCVCVTFTSPATIDGSCSKLWVEIVTNTGIVVATPDQCAGNTPSGIDSYIVAPNCSTSTPVTFASVGFGYLGIPYSATLCPAGPSISINNVTKAEGNWWGVTIFKFDVTRSETTDACSVDYSTADGSATTADNDYSTLTGTLHWSNGGSDVKSIWVAVRKDNKGEPDENFFVNLSNPVDCGIDDGTGEGTILNDDGAPLIGNNDPTQHVYANSQTSEEVSIFPNPSKSDINVIVPEKWAENDTVKASIFNNMGQLVNTLNLSQTQGHIDISDLPQGVYNLVILNADGQKTTKKFLKIN
jgi:hypothetical protein